MAGPQILQEEFDRFVSAALSPHLTVQEYVDHRRTFFAGVAAFLGAIIPELSPGDDVSDMDERMVRWFTAELREFNEAVKRGEK